jgi:DNA-binding GntR family transcriptional regulator
MEYPPGAALSESALRPETGVGRTPIREALQQLAIEGLIQIIPRKGTFVQPLQLDDIRKIYELRLEIEGLGARWAATRATPQEKQEMLTLVASLQGNLPGGGADLDAQFHALIAQASHNPYLKELHSRLYALSLRLLRLANQVIDEADLRTARPEYEAIVDAICSGQGELAEELLRGHIRKYPGRIVAYLTQFDADAPAIQLGDEHAKADQGSHDLAR